MNPVIFYAAKVILCSGVLFGYYWLALRNKTFHQWNRFYLLGCVVLSLTAPLLKLDIGPAYGPAQGNVFRILNVVTEEGAIEVESSGRATFALTADQWAWLAYAFISLLLFSVIVASSVRIYNILHSYPKTTLGSICFLNTDAKGTPFSFFHYIVWNRAIDLTTENGQRIFQHEVVHVQQRHTWDKVFLLLILIPFWINPFFWLIRKELTALHEFTADQKAVRTNDTTALAQMILNTTFPQQHFLFTNHLFQSTIKRRIAMFTKLQNPKVSYLSRILALPLLLIVIAAFSIKKGTAPTTQAVVLDKMLTVVIDAGHGSKSGARIDGVYEDDITLAISKQIKEQNQNKNIRIVLTREDDQNVDLHKRVTLAAENKADLFISIHLGVAPPSVKAGRQIENPANGMEVFVSTKNPPYQKQSVALGSILTQELSGVYKTNATLTVKQIGVWVLDKNVCPSALIECGYLTNKNDFAFIREAENQKRIAGKILDAIAQYGVLKNMGSIKPATDTVPKVMYKNKEVDHVTYIKDEKDEVEITYKNGDHKEMVKAKVAREANLLDSNATNLTVFTPPVIVKDTTPVTGDITVRKTSLEEAKTLKDIVIELDGKIFKGAIKDLPVQPNEIESISIVSGDAIQKQYGLQAGGSLLSITTKPYSEKMRRERDPATKPIFSKTEVDATFPPEDGGWQAFLMKNLNASVAVANGAKTGTYKVEVQFIVDRNGKISDIKPLTHHGHGMEDEVVRLMKLSPDWIPVKQNGRNVTAYHKQPATFVIAE